MNRELLQRVFGTLNNIIIQNVDADEILELIAAIEAELAKPFPEPAAWIFSYSSDGNTQDYVGINKPLFKDDWLVKIEPLYTSPPMRDPLSSKKISEIWLSLDTPIYDDFARAIEKEIRGGQ